MYDDFQILSEDKFGQIQKAYNEKLKNVKVYNENIDFKENLNLLFKNLNESLHFLDNLINLSKNANLLKELQDIKVVIKQHLEDLKNLYEINETLTEDNKLNLETNFHKNLISCENCLLSFLENLFNFIKIENNNKIITALDLIFKNILSEVIKLNNLKTIQPKIFSLFRKY